MNIGVYIETGCINTLTASDSIIDQLAVLDQAESQFRSENIKFGIRHRMRSGKTLLNHTRFLGYTKGTDGVLRIVPEEAEIVRTIFDLYVQGNGVRKIKKYLESHGIKTVTGKSEWSTSTIDRMLSNEKYVGQVLMQKSYVPDFLTGKKEKNRGLRRRGLQIPQQSPAHPRSGLLLHGINPATGVQHFHAPVKTLVAFKARRMRKRKIHGNMAMPHFMKMFRSEFPAERVVRRDRDVRTASGPEADRIDFRIDSADSLHS